MKRLILVRRFTYLRMRGKLPVSLIAGLALSVQLCAGAEYPTFYGVGDPGAIEAFAEEAKADFSIIYDHDGKLNIGVGPVRDGIYHPISFTFDELRSFWERQRHKAFIVVTLSKANRTDDETRKLVERINGYFFEHGYRRVRIHQAYGAGVGVMSDSQNPAKPIP